MSRWALSSYWAGPPVSLALPAFALGDPMHKSAVVSSSVRSGSSLTSSTSKSSPLIESEQLNCISLSILQYELTFRERRLLNSAGAQLARSCSSSLASRVFSSERILELRLGAFKMGRFASVLFVALLVGAVAVRGDDKDDPWFPDPFWSDSPPPPADASPPPPLYPAPDAPSPYYDSPPYDGGSPVYPPPESYPPIDGPAPDSWWSHGLWSQRTSDWPAPWKPDTPVEDAFGTDAVKVYGQVSMLDGILAKGEDGYSDLLKQGITALLNAVDKHFKYTEDEIKKCFSFKTALSSEAAATVQAKDFESANEVYTSSSP